MNSQKNKLAPETNDIPSSGLELKHVGVGSNIILIKMKTCSKCKVPKEESEFYERRDKKDKSGTIKRRKDCKECVANIAKKHYLKDPEKAKRRSYEWGKNNRSKRRKSQRDWEHKNKEKVSSKRKTPEYRANSKIRRDKTKDIRNAKRRQYNLENPDKAKELNEIAKQKRKQNPEKYRKQDNERYHKNKNNPCVKEQSKRQRERRKPKRNAFEVKKREENPLYRMTLNLRSRTSKVFDRGGYTKDSKTEEMLGVDYETVKKHLERLFLPGMSWGNYGKKSGLTYWEIDHAIPLSSAKTIEGLTLLCHYTNLQPLWSVDNNKKNGKIIQTQMKITI